jgi:hypothetical protein
VPKTRPARSWPGRTHSPQTYLRSFALDGSVMPGMSALVLLHKDPQISVRVSEKTPSKQLVNKSRE